MSLPALMAWGASWRTGLDSVLGGSAPVGGANPAPAQAAAPAAPAVFGQDNFQRDPLGLISLGANPAAIAALQPAALPAAQPVPAALPAAAPAATQAAVPNPNAPIDPATAQQLALAEQEIQQLQAQLQQLIQNYNNAPAPAAPPPPPPPPPAPPPPPPPAPPAPPAAQQDQTYTVQSGDSLWAIAQNKLGDGNRWHEIYDLNKDVVGANPDLIYPGQVLKLPGGNSTSAPAPAPAPAPSPGHDVPSKAPEISQYHPNGAAQGYTNGPSNCGPTSMAMIARAFGWGGNLSDAKLINTLGKMGGTTSAGTSVNGIVAMAKGIGKSGTIKQGPDANWIKQQLQSGKLVVANGDYFAMAPHANPGRIGQGGHYVAVVGMQGNDFIVNDPADTNVHLVSPAALEKFIRSNTNGGYEIAVG